MQNLKQIIHDIADKLPEQATFDDAMYALYVRQKIDNGLKQLDEGRGIPHEQVKRKICTRTEQCNEETRTYCTQ
ncbi:MAG TPA: hypothetical protein VFY78_02350 [Gammaproteobacteria bacterium]|nr:hypothetical protein [Gammaproteobacteria bacterium]